MGVYDDGFFGRIREASLASARVVWPLALGLVPARTVVDVGCGECLWLSVARDLGCTVRGFDGAYVDRSRLMVPEACFVAADLEQPLPPAGRFDLATCLETAEHLSPARSQGLVDDLVALSDVVVFSAAAPRQGGTHHVNEQWPSYWVERFARRGYRCIDAFRPRIWDDPTVCWWYRQNLFLAVASSRLGNGGPLDDALARHGAPRDMAHPEMYRQMCGQADYSGEIRNHSLGGVLRALPGMVAGRIGDTLSGRQRGPG